MGKLTKENKGITLVALIITVVLMLILTSITTYTGIDTYKSMKVTKFITQMQLIQGKVDELKQSKTIEELLAMGELIPNDKISIITTAKNTGEITSDDSSSYRYFSSENIRTELDLDDGIDGEIMINFDTREVVSTIGVEKDNQIYYTQYLLPGGQKLIDITEQANRDKSFYLNPSIDGLNATVTVNLNITNATLSYNEEGSSNWNTITNYTESNKEYSVLISKSGTYEFKLLDNVTKEESQKVVILKLANSPKTEIQIAPYDYNLTSENWAYAKNTNGDSYVWIPRFAYDNSNNIKFIKGISNVATDNTYIDSTWNIHEKFKQGEEELTGIWIQSDKTNNLDMITLLNDSSRTTLIEI